MGIYIASISVHGLIRADQLELGRDADTGGQTKYVVELARALAADARVERIDLITRRIEDAAVGPDYAVPIEPLGDGARIVRIPAGPPDYIVKEALWDHLDPMVDNLLAWFSDSGQLPDIIHSHYADAGYVGSRLSSQLGIPLVHTGHSLGRIKRARLLASGLTADDIESRFNMSRRIEAEELTLASAERVIASTHQEVEEQYERYDFYQPDRMQVVPPGIDLGRFHPPTGDEWNTPIARELTRFLRETERPIVLAVARADTRKNLSALVEAFGADEALRASANLVVVAGNREDVRDLDEPARDVWDELLLLIDRHNLYGQVAYPKHHAPDDVPMLYRLAASTSGVFVNPALTEPFGLTLLEAAASGLPIVATEDGGPTDIVANCANGVLVNPLDVDDIASGIREVLGDWETWQQRSLAGLAGVREHYSWAAHANAYLDLVSQLAREASPLAPAPVTRRRQLYRSHAIFTDIDQSLLAAPDAVPEFVDAIRAQRRNTYFGIATGRRLESALAIMRRHRIPEPDVLITSTGTAVYYAPELTADEQWTGHIERQWTPAVIRRLLSGLPGLKLQPRVEQTPYKLSYYIDPAVAPDLADIQQLLYKEEQAANVVLSFGQYLDVLPQRASKGLALRYVAARWNVPLENVLVAGGSGADEDMMRGNTRAVVVGNRHHEELSDLADVDGIYFASARGAGGLLEAMRHYDFPGETLLPEPDADD